MNTPDPVDARFDRALRAVHADAVAHVSAATMAQLHRRRHAALSGAPARAFRGWPLAAAGLASLLVVAVGLGFALRPGDGPAPSTPAVAGVDANGDGLEEVITDLDESPDFYVWLASGDADLLAME